MRKFETPCSASLLAALHFKHHVVLQGGDVRVPTPPSGREDKAQEGGEEAGLGEEPAGAEPAAEPATTESFKKDGTLLTEEKRRKYEEKTKRYQGIYLRRLTESLENNDHIHNLDSVEKDTDVLNSKISEMTKEIDKLTK